LAIEELRSKLATLLTEAEGIAAKEELADDDATRLEEITAEGTDVRAKIEALEKSEGLRSWAKESAGRLPLASPNAKVEGLSPSGEANVKIKSGHVLVDDDGDMLIDEKVFKAITSPEYHRAFKSYLRHGPGGLKDSELKVLNEGTDTAGGYLVPDDVLARLIAKEPAPTNVAAFATRMNTSRDTLVMPKVTYTTDDIYTSGMRVTWTGETPASATTHRVTEPTFGQVRIPIYTAMMSLPLTNDMVEDSAVDITGWATGKFSETIDLLYDNMMINGTGAGQPAGILRNPNGSNEPATRASGAAAALTADGLIDLAFDIPEQYDINARFAFNKTSSGRAIAKLKDGDGRYLWGSGLQDSGLQVPAIKGRDLLGYPVVLNALMPNVGAGLYPIIFGDFGGYYLVNRIGFSIQVLRELYAETNQILLLGRIRFGGLVAEDWKLKIQVVSA
jgi:HK97 family phage major capsid protein